MDTATKTVLIVEDDEDIASALSRGLSREGYSPMTAHSLPEAMTRLEEADIQAAIVDMMLGDDMGTDLVRAIRGRGGDYPVIILSAMSGVEDRASGLEAGADDYVVKPFAFSELLARLRVQERRHGGRQGPLSYLGLGYDPKTRLASDGRQQVSLTEKEGRLIEVFLRSPDQVFGRAELFEMLWAGDGRTSENVVDVYIGYLRRKLRPIADTKAGIVTIRGKGFMLTEAPDDHRQTD